MNQLSQLSRARSGSDSSSELLSGCKNLRLRLGYSLRGLWLTRWPDEQSLHQRSTTDCREAAKVGPSVLTYKKLLSVEQLRFVFLLVLIIFRVQKRRSKFAVEKGKLKRSLAIIKSMFGYFALYSVMKPSFIASLNMISAP